VQEGFLQLPGSGLVRLTGEQGVELLAGGFIGLRHVGGNSPGDRPVVSPESSLLDVGADGYIAQVWTGTSRAVNGFQGVKAERTFDTAFLEYGALQNIARSSGERIWYLNDPIEDNPNHSWADYKRNWESTLAASLLQPEVSNYEILPLRPNQHSFAVATSIFRRTPAYCRRPADW
jgi:hypothetical protein